MTTSHAHPVDAGRVEHVRAHLPDREEAERLVTVLGLLADPTCVRVLYALDAVEELCVGDLALALAGSQDTVGYALRILRTAGLVAARKQGPVVFYRLAVGFPEPLREHCLTHLVNLTRRPQAD